MEHFEHFGQILETRRKKDRLIIIIIIIMWKETLRGQKTVGERMTDEEYNDNSSGVQ